MSAYVHILGGDQTTSTRRHEGHHSEFERYSPSATSKVPAASLTSLYFAEPLLAWEFRSGCSLMVVVETLYASGVECRKLVEKILCEQMVDMEDL